MSVGLAGCGAGASDCVATPGLFPANVIRDHTAPAPDNQVTYGVGVKVLQGHCDVPASLAGVQSLSVSDPQNVQVGSNGFVATVTCLAPTDGPVTVTSGTLTAQLVCR